MVKKSLIFIAVIIVLIVFDIRATNIIYDSKLKETIQNQENIITDSNGNPTQENIGVSDSVEVFVTKERWYGIISEVSTKDSIISELNLFKAVTIPLKINKYNFVIAHMTTLIISLFLIIIGIVWDIVDYKKNKGVIKRWSYTGLGEQQ